MYPHSHAIITILIEQTYFIGCEARAEFKKGFFQRQTNHFGSSDTAAPRLQAENNNGIIKATKKKKKKKKTCFTGERTCKVGSVGRAFFVLNFFFISGTVATMTLKTQQFGEKKFDIFCRKVLGKYVDLFSNFFS